MLFLKQSTASQAVLIGPFLDDTDFVTEETGLTIANTDIRISKNGANTVAKNSGGGTHDELGWYQITLDATDTNTVGTLQVYVSVAGALPVWHEFTVLEENVYDAIFAASAALGTDVASILTDTGTTLDGKLNTIDTVVDSILDDTGTSGVQVADKTGYSLSGTINTLDDIFSSVGTAQTGGSDSITLASGDSATDDLYNLQWIRILSGTGAGQSRFISNYVGSTKVATVEPNWATTPDNTSVYAIFPAGSVDVQAWGSSNISASQISGAAGGLIPTNVNQISGDSTAANNLESAYDGTGYKDVNNFYVIRSATAQAGAAGTITLDASASATDDFYNNTYIQIISGTGAGQARFISDYVGSTKVASVNANWVTNPSSDSVFVIWPFGTIPGASAPTAAEVADAVWDEPKADHTGATTFGDLATDLDAVLTDTAEIGSAGAGLTEAGGTGDHLTAVPWNAAWDAEAQSEAADALTAFFTSSAQLVDDVWDEVITGAAHNVNNSAAKFLREGAEGIGLTGTAQAGAAGTITLAATASATDDLYNGERIQIIEGTGAGQGRLITDYNGTTKVATLDRNWTTTPDNTSVYSIVGADVDVRAVSGDAVAADNLELDYDGTGYNKSNSTVGTATNLTNANPTAAAIRAEIDSNSTQLAAIVADTNELQGDWANGGRLDLIVDAILADTNELQSDDYPTTLASLSTKLDTIDDFLDTEIAAILEDTGTTIPALIAALNDLSAAEVNAEVVDALSTDTYAEPASVPAATASLATKIGWLYILSRNKITQTATTQTLRNDADSGNVGTASVSDDGTTATKGEWS